MRIASRLKDLKVGEEIKFSSDQYSAIVSTASRLKREGYGKYVSKFDKKNNTLTISRISDTSDTRGQTAQDMRKRTVMRVISEDLQWAASQFDPFLQQAEIVLRIRDKSGSSSIRIDVTDNMSAAAAALQSLIVKQL